MPLRKFRRGNTRSTSRIYRSICLLAGYSIVESANNVKESE